MSTSRMELISTSHHQLKATWTEYGRIPRRSNRYTSQPTGAVFLHSMHFRHFLLLLLASDRSRRFSIMKRIFAIPKYDVVSTRLCVQRASSTCARLLRLEERSNKRRRPCTSIGRRETIMTGSTSGINRKKTTRQTGRMKVVMLVLGRPKTRYICG